MGAKGSKDREIFVQKQATEEPVHDHKHIENDDTAATKVFILREGANDYDSSGICLKNSNQESITCQLKRENKPIRIPTACHEDKSDTDLHMIIKGSSKAEHLKYNKIRQDSINSIKTELKNETTTLANEKKGQRSGPDGMKPGQVSVMTTIQTTYSAISRNSLQDETKSITEDDILKNCDARKAQPEPKEMSPVEQLFEEDLILEFSENSSSQEVNPTSNGATKTESEIHEAVLRDIDEWNRGANNAQGFNATKFGKQTKRKISDPLDELMSITSETKPVKKKEKMKIEYDQSELDLLSAIEKDYG